MFLIDSLTSVPCFPYSRLIQNIPTAANMHIFIANFTISVARTFLTGFGLDIKTLLAKISPPTRLPKYPFLCLTKTKLRQMLSCPLEADVSSARQSIANTHHAEANLQLSLDLLYYSEAHETY